MVVLRRGTGHDNAHAKMDLMKTKDEDEIVDLHHLLNYGWDAVFSVRMHSVRTVSGSVDGAHGRRFLPLHVRGCQNYASGEDVIYCDPVNAANTHDNATAALLVYMIIRN
jgi:hypothetical protein